MDKDLLLLKLNEKWNCCLPFGWIPITGDQEISNVKIFDSNYFNYYTEAVKEVIESKFGVLSLFEIREDGRFRKSKIDDCDFSYDGLEYIYTNETLDFVLYFSHESSTTIGGKDLLEELYRVWPEAEYHLWKHV